MIETPVVLSAFKTGAAVSLITILGTNVTLQASIIIGIVGGFVYLLTKFAELDANIHTKNTTLQTIATIINGFFFAIVMAGITMYAGNGIVISFFNLSPDMGVGVWFLALLTSYKADILINETIPKILDKVGLSILGKYFGFKEKTQHKNEFEYADYDDEVDMYSEKQPKQPTQPEEPKNYKGEE